MSTLRQHTEGDCWPDTCRFCAQEDDEKGAGPEVTRENQAAEHMYVLEDGRVFVVAPDGVGRYWYDDEDEAHEQHGEDVAVHYVEDVDE
jgi:hypothetical protein